MAGDSEPDTFSPDSQSSENTSYIRQHSIAFKLLAMILLCSSIITLLTTGLILFNDYHRESNTTDEFLARAVLTSIGGLGHSIWHFDNDTTKIQLEGLLNVQGVQYAKITTTQDTSMDTGQMLEGKFVIRKQWPITYDEQEIGQLDLLISKEFILNNVMAKGFNILLSQAAKTFIVSIIILWLVHRIITRHIIHISEYSASMKTEALDKILKLEKRFDNDEIDRLVTSLNHMRLTMQKDFQAKEDAEKALTQLTNSLEIKVKERTKELEAANNYLSDLISELKTAQQKLILSEKSAALGQLVFGVAHELNTPLGNAIMASSGIAHELEKDAEFQQPQMIIEFCEITQKNLKRAADIIQAFRQLAANRDEPDDYFNLYEALTIALPSLLMKVHKESTITLDIPETLQITTKKSALLKCVESLVVNAQYHGYGTDNPANILISAKEEDNELSLIVKDFGKGIQEELKYRIFDPFFTTDRISGKIGIGLSVIHHIVSTLMAGHVECESVYGQGSEFSIIIPMHSGSHAPQPPST